MVGLLEEERRSLHFSSDQQAAQFLQKMGQEISSSSSGRNGGSGSGVSDAEAEKKRKMKEMVDSIPTAR